MHITDIMHVRKHSYTLYMLRGLYIYRTVTNVGGMYIANHHLSCSVIQEQDEKTLYYLLRRERNQHVSTKLTSRETCCRQMPTFVKQFHAIVAYRWWNAI